MQVPPLTSGDETRAEPNWYVVHCKPRQESIAQQQLDNQGYCTYLPWRQVERRQRGQWQTVHEPLFPGYLFIALDLRHDNSAPIRSTRGVRGLVRFGSDYPCLPAILIAELKQQEAAQQHDEQGLQPGERVIIASGPFAGLQGIFDRAQGDKRVQILLTLLGQTQRLTLHRNEIDRPAGRE